MASSEAFFAIVFEVAEKPKPTRVFLALAVDRGSSGRFESTADEPTLTDVAGTESSTSWPLMITGVGWRKTAPACCERGSIVWIKEDGL